MGSLQDQKYEVREEPKTHAMIQKSEFSDDLEFLDKKYSERERQLLSAESSADLQYFVSFWWARVGELGVQKSGIT